MDDDDKIRRNLIVTSAIIIGAAWFNVSLPDVLERLFSIKSTSGTQTVQVADWKLWVAALVALGYMAWRYRWSDEVEEAIKRFQTSVAARYQVIYRSSYLGDVAAWFRAGTLPTDAHPQLTVAFNQAVPEAMVRQLGRRPDLIEFGSVPSPAMNQGNQQIVLDAIWGTIEQTSQVNKVQVNLYIDLRRQLRLKRLATSYALLNSKASMSLVWPVLIAGTALVIAIHKLMQSLIS